MSEKFGYRQVEHTADLALHIEGEILPDVYRFAAEGMFDCIAGLDNIEPKSGERIEIKGHDLEDLLVSMLSELLYKFSTMHILYSEFIIEYLTHEKVIIFAKGEQLDEQKHSVKAEIKAATHHDLKIEATDDGFEATVVFDV